jgi:ATP-dependent DNA helicase RecG
MEIRRWLDWDEGQTFERKSCFDKQHEPPKRLKAADVARLIAETLCAYANADGGVLLVGQEDSDVGHGESPGRVTGVPYPEDKISILLDAPRNLIVPPLTNVTVTDEIVDGERCLAFEMGASPVAHRLTDGRCLLRMDDQSVPYSQDTVARLKSSQSPYERRPVPAARLDDLDPAALTWFAERVRWTGDTLAMLQAYRLWDRDQLNRAALLLFARDPLRWQDHSDATVVRYAGTDRGLGNDYDASRPVRLEAPLVRLIEAMTASVAEHLRRRVAFQDLLFTEQWEYPTAAWQEAVVNAIAHRDYSLTGAGIEAWLFDDRMEVRSPGAPPDPITVEELRSGQGVHYSRNPLIARALTDCGYMREQGEGIPRMFDAMLSADLQPPSFQISGFRFVVTLRNTPVWSRETRQWLATYADQDLSRDQMRVLAYAHEHGLQFTSREIQNLLNIDIYAASSLIKSLMRKAVVELRARGGRVYEVLPPLLQRPVPEALQHLLPAFRETDKVTNADLQRIWGLPRKPAYHRAKALVDEGWLEPVGRGRGAGYILLASARNVHL